MSLERLTHEDARILALDAGAVRGHTCKVIVAGRPPDDGLEAVRAHVAARLSRAPRLRQRLAPTPLGLAPAAWVDEEGFDIARHVVGVPTKAPVDRDELRRIVGRLMAERLDVRRPLWRMDVVEQLEDGGIAIVVRMHHCMADGTMAMQILSSTLLDTDAEPQAPAPDRWEPAPAPGAPALLAFGVVDRLRRLGGGVMRGTRELLSRGSLRDAAAALARLPTTVRRELLGGGAASPLAAPIGDERLVAFTSVPLAAVKQIEACAPERVTVNDIVLAAVGGGLRRWLEHRGAGMSGLRAKVPVSLHHQGDRGDGLANRDSFMFIDLPLAEPDPVRRLSDISSETRERKLHHDAETLDAFSRDLSHVSGSLERLADRWAMSPRVFALNVSNVRGPHEPLFVMGAPLRELYTLAEVANRHALRASILSAAGTLAFGLCADASVVDDLDLVTRGIDDELGALLARS